MIPAASDRWRSACRSPSTPSGRRHGCSYNGGNNRGGGIDFAGFAPPPVRERTCLIFNTIGPDRARGDARDPRPSGGLPVLRRRRRRAGGGRGVRSASTTFVCRCAPPYAARSGWRRADLREDPGDLHDVLRRARARGAGALRPPPAGRPPLAAAAHQVRRPRRRRARGGARGRGRLGPARRASGTGRPLGAGAGAATAPARRPGARLGRLPPGRARGVLHGARAPSSTRATTAPTATRGAAGRASTPPSGAGTSVSMGEDLAAVKISGWTHMIPEYFDFARFWAGYPGCAGPACGGGWRRSGHRRVTPPRPGPARPRLGHAPPVPHQLAGDRRRRARQPGRRAPVQGVQRPAHAQRRAGRRRLHGAVPARVRLRAHRPVDGRGLRRRTRATPPTTARRSPTPSTPPTSSTSRAVCSA